MNKVISKSDNGFQLDTFVFPDHPEHIGYNLWFTVDTYKIINNKQNRLKFQSLKVGDTISSLELQKGKNGKDYVTSFSVVGLAADAQAHTISPLLSHPQSLSGTDSSPSSPNNNGSSSPLPDIKASDMDRKILKGQCLNIAFQDCDDFRFSSLKLRIQNAKELFKQVEEFGFYGW